MVRLTRTAAAAVPGEADRTTADQEGDQEELCLDFERRTERSEIGRALRSTEIDSPVLSLLSLLTLLTLRRLSVRLLSLRRLTVGLLTGRRSTRRSTEERRGREVNLRIRLPSMGASKSDV